MRKLIDDAVADGVFPGAAWAVRDGVGVTFGVAGTGTRDTLWDLASLSKVVATTSLAMRAVDRGDLDLDCPVAESWPEFAAGGKQRVTPRDLLSHEAGFVPFRPYHQLASSREDVVRRVAAEPGGGPPVYSDLSMIALAEVLERLGGARLDTLFVREIAAPLGLRATGYRPLDGRLIHGPIAPTEATEPWRGSDEPFVLGVVHDPTAWRMDGVAGHAGLFSTVDDLAVFADALLAGAISPHWREWTRPRSERTLRALGWDTSPGFFGHTGFTGTSIQIGRAHV